MPATGDDRLNRKIVTGRKGWANERDACARMLNFRRDERFKRKLLRIAQRQPVMAAWDAGKTRRTRRQTMLMSIVVESVGVEVVVRAPNSMTPCRRRDPKGAAHSFRIREQLAPNQSEAARSTRRAAGANRAAHRQIAERRPRWPSPRAKRPGANAR
jgi:hypothetical protein